MFTPSEMTLARIHSRRRRRCYIKQKRKKKKREESPLLLLARSPLVVCEREAAKRDQDGRPAAVSRPRNHRIKRENEGERKLGRFIFFLRFFFAPRRVREEKESPEGRGSHPRPTTQHPECWLALGQLNDHHHTLLGGASYGHFFPLFSPGVSKVK